MVLRENSKKPQMHYWEHERKPHQCNHYDCEGVIQVSKVIHKDTSFILAYGFCPECGQRYLIGEAPEWFNARLMTRQEAEKTQHSTRQTSEQTERGLKSWPAESELQNINQLARMIITATS